MIEIDYLKLIEDVGTSIYNSVCKLIKNAPFDKSFRAQVTKSLGNDKYEVLYKGNVYTVKCKVDLSVGDFVTVCASQNNWNELVVTEISTAVNRELESINDSLEKINASLTQLNSDLKNYATIAGAQALINKSYNKMNIYYVGTDSKTTIKLKCTSTTTGAHIWGFLFMEQNGNPFAAILTPYRGMSELINYKGWKCTYSEPEYTITANAWSYGFFLTVETFEISYE